MTIETLGAMVRRALDDRPSAVFLSSPGRPDLDYAGADRRSGQLANALVHLGVAPGDRVAVQIEKSPTSVLLYLACLRLGAAVLPMNTAYTAPEVEYLVGDAEPTLLVRDPGGPSGPARLRSIEVDARGGGALADAADAEDPEFADVARGPDDLAAILYTSGTTGRPKGAALSHRNLATNAEALSSVWAFQPDDVLLHALPLFHTHGLFVATNCVLWTGAAMVLLDRFDVDAVVTELPRCSVFMGIPTFYTRLLADPRLTPELCRGVRLFTSGSAPMLPATHEAFTDRTGQPIVERYGMTETTILTSTRPGGPPRVGSVGWPLPGVEVRIEGDAPGGIEVRGPNVFGGYWGRPELTATEFTADGFFRTGDLGALDPDGCLRIVGRSKDLVISGGFNVYPIEVETALNGLEGVAESAVIGLPDDDLGERVVAVVVAEPGQVLDEAALRAAVRTRLAGYKVPKSIQVITELPRNAMGKVEKQRLRQQLGPTG